MIERKGRKVMWMTENKREEGRAEKHKNAEK